MLQPSMHQHVVGVDHDFQVIDPVVINDPILVMHDLIREQVASNVSRHDNTMLWRVSASDGHVHIPVLAGNEPPAFPVGITSSLHRNARTRAVRMGGANHRGRLALKRHTARFAHEVEAILPGDATTFQRTVLSPAFEVCGLSREWRVADGADTLNGHRNLQFRCRAGSVHSTARLHHAPNYTLCGAP